MKCLLEQAGKYKDNGNSRFGWCINWGNFNIDIIQDIVGNLFDLKIEIGGGVSLRLFKNN